MLYVELIRKSRTIAGFTSPDHPILLRLVALPADSPAAALVEPPASCLLLSLEAREWRAACCLPSVDGTQLPRARRLRSAGARAPGVPNWYGSFRGRGRRWWPLPCRPVRGSAIRGSF